MYPPNQRPHKDQNVPLSIDRVQSSIPKSEGEEKWVYPSPQMFFNAMKRKGYEPQETDMNIIVAIHNEVNERCWRSVLQWESLHIRQCPDVKLVRFRGRPDELTPKARWRTWMGHAAPFDRHDWVVDRCGREVRYIVDFYAVDLGPDMPPLTRIDARPALDSLQSLYDRLRIHWHHPPPPPSV